MILFFGKSGQLAKSFQNTIPPHLEGSTVFLSSHDANFLEPQMLPGLLDHYGPSVVVLCSAYTQVDKAEEEQALADSINHKAPQKIAQWCATNDCYLIHFSTDYVYSGSLQIPYAETDEPKPLNVYGETKLAGDNAIRISGARHLIFRTSWVYSEFGKNFVKTMLRMGKDKDQLRVVSDQIGCPTYAPEIAELVWKIILDIKSGQKYKTGIYHLCGGGSTSWAGFASEIFRQAKELGFDVLPPSIVEIPSSDYQTLADRPKYTVLSQDKFINTFEFETKKWQDSLNLCLRRLKSESLTK